AADENTFVECSIDIALETLNGRDLSDTEVRQALLECRLDQSTSLMPSVETFLHGYLLSLADINWVGHTHPTAVNSILCAANSREAVSGRLFPDEVVCCGPAVCYVEYTDPGLPLARCLRDRVEAFIDTYNMAPKVILMENHGLIATGKTTRDVETATSMYVKTARVLLGTFCMGGPRYMTQENVDRIHTRPDEHYRQRQIGSAG
ncbi:MAG: class II aldolase/adducin family protein, partial [Chthonomonadales bacterium]